MEEKAVLTMPAHGRKENVIQSCIMFSGSNGAEEQILSFAHERKHLTQI